MKAGILKVNAAVFILAGALFFSSCKRDVLESVSEQITTGPYASLQDFYDQNGVQEQAFTINPTQPSTVVGAGGLQVVIPADALQDASGNSPAGNVTVTIKEIYDISNMILSNVTTTSSGSMLESGGMFFISFTANSIFYFPNTMISIKIPNQNPQTGMQTFLGNPYDSSGVAINWSPLDTANSLIWPDTSFFPSYIMVLDTIGYGWVNCDRFYNSIPTTDVVINSDVISEHNESVNLAVYLAFPSINSCLIAFDPQQDYSATAYSIPENMQAAAIVIGTGRVTKKLYFGITEFTVTASQQVSVSVSQSTEAQLIAALQAL
jgi:hypothetical protein